MYDPVEPDSLHIPGPEEKNWAMFCHLAAFAGFILPLGNIIAPLALWLMKKQESPYVDHHGREVLNFQITALIALVVCWLLAFVLIGFVLMVLLGALWLVFTLVGLVKASQGDYFRYPLTLRLLH
ncbi:DUF4870 domain-containing protein [Zobellella maritima]|uniref:DUF4870 domain-containing protein n=1 Tax=Zobellella maritima TaxID=2059725 RepID=UPI000E306D4A|nr:DUF4870 domain-containing protein [Zobellella maritima]